MYVPMFVCMYVHLLSLLERLHLLMDFNIIHTNVGYDDISSKSVFWGPGLEVKVTSYF